ncbi:hypothetical protein SEA_BISKIT_44 [Gordonia phage Biskit]|uniref:Uncharacterized protein n=4 Tax=Emalynvirus troje TaxID=2560511 RepID=A0A2K9VEV2_9CAUD|nr:hypothetical protein FDJ27_gp44 [Gordonia phage Troje]AXH45142.1 hypothetical protein SEA_SKETCHMEX_42 [Gordonia phage SketchMex]QNJ59474.1 hypothetical protein SEA_BUTTRMLKDREAMS_44 [Gordonia phage Buttrmlkdreams]QWY84917.1 hypothetical protein SEA_MSCARN_46 [Gordonia phage MScarn]UVK62083.1 hypothetical protein SEA_BISKIT_44 [Gordonia phage Biskit]AUV60749.1 hypothetical protein SEA_TROJE_44 [Gordonia phage Troje]
MTTRQTYRFQGDEGRIRAECENCLRVLPLSSFNSRGYVRFRESAFPTYPPKLAGNKWDHDVTHVNRYCRECESAGARIRDKKLKALDAEIAELTTKRQELLDE